jgi:hypothetical protein
MEGVRFDEMVTLDGFHGITHSPANHGRQVSERRTSDSALAAEIRMDARRAIFFGGAEPNDDSGPPIRDDSSPAA